jgi:ATP-GRASP peptide maturase of grasp-with-spasm system
LVLIISNNYDLSTNHVIDWLLFYGTKFIRLNDTDIVNIESLEISDQGTKVRLKSNDVVFCLDEITAVWYRRGFLNIAPSINAESTFRDFDDRLHNQILKHLFEEKSVLINYVNSLLNLKPHINSLDCGNVNKLKCLRMAVEVGLNIPETYVITKKDKIKLQPYITKALSNNPNIWDGSANEEYYCSTERIDLARMKNDVCFPSLIQQEISKDFEIRSFFLNDKFYSIAIFSQSREETKIDFRNNEGCELRKCAYRLPGTIIRKLKRLNKKMNLTSGSIDLIFKSGHYYFLEINPVGQFGDVSYVGNYYLEREIANFLSKHESKK